MASKKSSQVTGTQPLHNPALPRVSITINEQTYLLEYDFNAVARAEELAGLNLFSSFDFTQLSATKLRAMLYASLLKNQPKITLEQAGDLISVHTLPALVVNLVEAWNGSRPEVTEDEKGNAKAEADDDPLDINKN